MLDGIINIYKEKGYTSHDVVAKLRRITGQKKIGHTGTLDPDAEGVLPVCLGKATKLCEYITDKDKEYIARVKLGVTTDTLDMSGNILSESKFTGNLSDIEKACESFSGDIMQIPPMYSAIKVGGKKLYELARNNIEIDRKPRAVHIYDIKASDYDSKMGEFTLYAHVSKGTYIRSLCDDIGKKLSCGACMKELVRTRTGTFDINDALKLSDIEAIASCGIDSLKQYLTDVFCVFTMKKVILKNQYDVRVQNGNTISNDMFTEYDKEDKGLGVKPFISTGNDDISVFYSDGRFAAVYRPSDSDGCYLSLIHI